MCAGEEADAARGDAAEGAVGEEAAVVAGGY